MSEEMSHDEQGERLMSFSGAIGTLEEKRHDLVGVMIPFPLIEKIQKATEDLRVIQDEVEAILDKEHR